jgi:vesicle coat complex subunit
MLDAIVGESIITIRYLLSTKHENDIKISHQKLLTYLASIYESITVPMARASILWLIGHHLDSFYHAPDALRIALKSFSIETPFVKKQILTLSTLLLLHVTIQAKGEQTKERYNQEISGFLSTCFGLSIRLAKLDLNFDVRDQARFLEACMTELETGSEEVFFQLLTQLAPLISMPPKIGKILDLIIRITLSNRLLIPLFRSKAAWVCFRNSLVYRSLIRR